MKNLRSKIVTLIVLVVLLTISTLPVLAADSENIIIKRAEHEFVIYYKDICNEEFQFAFSNDDEELDADLHFINSAKDNESSDYLNIVYIDETLYNQYFNNGDTYIWIKLDGNYPIKAEKVDLDKAINDETIEKVYSITKRINVDTTKTNEINKNIDGIKTKITTGKIVINPVEGNKYYYQLSKVSDNSNDYAKLFNTVIGMKKEIGNTYNKLNLEQQFIKLYNDLVPDDNDENWTEVSNNEILQPEETADGDRYIVWLKEENPDGVIKDAQFLESTYKQERVQEEEKVVKEVVKVPVTYDSASLFVILGIILIAILVVVIMKVRSNKKEKNK